MKFHFVSCTDPLKEGVDCLAVCGEVIERTRFAMFIDQDVVSVEDLRRSMGLCSKCREADLDHRLVYIVCSGKQQLREFSDEGSSPSQP
jgi:hypothetical protein